jgi:hypothetical protein
MPRWTLCGAQRKHRALMVKHEGGAGWSDATSRIRGIGRVAVARRRPKMSKQRTTKRLLFAALADATPVPR